MKVGTHFWTEIVDKNLPRNMSCCPGRAKIGESILLFKTPSSSGLNATFAFHRHCLSNAIAQMPMSEAEEDINRAWDELREDILASGKLFPEEQNDGQECDSLFSTTIRR